MRFALVLPTLVEQIPRAAGVALRAELGRAVERALARNDQPELERLYRQLSLLLRSLPLEEAHDDQLGGDTVQAEALAPQRRRARPSSWRRPHAPIAFPYGDPPPSRRPVADGYVSQPIVRSSADCQARLDAYWRDVRVRSGDV